MVTKYSKRRDANHATCVKAIIEEVGKGNVLSYLETASLGHGIPDLMVSVRVKCIGERIIFIEIKNPEKSWVFTQPEYNFACAFSTSVFVAEIPEDIAVIIHHVSNNTGCVIWQCFDVLREVDRSKLVNKAMFDFAVR